MPAVAMDVELTAKQALARSKKVGGTGENDADKLNFSLTMKRVMKMIAATADKGERQLGYAVPWLVIDGTSTNNRMLARQIQKRLQTLGFSVERESNKLFISWDLELEAEEKRRAAEVKEEERKRMQALKDRAKSGSRPSRKVTKVTSFPTAPPGPEHAARKGKRSPGANGRTFSVSLKRQ